MFLPIQIKECPGFGFEGGPEFQTDIQSIASGHEKRNANWAVCRHRYTVPYANITDEAYLAIKTVFLLTRGKAHTFLHKDWADHYADNESIGTGDGTTTEFQLSKLSTMSGTSATYERVITKPADNVVVLVDGVPDTSATVDATSGKVTFPTAPANGKTVSWTGDFFVHVRFDNDYLPFTLDSRFQSGSYAHGGTIDLIEVLGEDEDAT